MVAKKLRFGLGFFYLCLSSVTVLEAAESPAGDELKPACCRYEGAEVAQLHKSADRLYSQFKPKDAVVELVKILRADGNKFEELVKLARAHIDIGDLVPENGDDRHERKLKEYTTAQDYAHEALQVDPNSTWSHFWIAAAVGSIAVVSPVSTQVDLAPEIRDEVEKAIALDAKTVRHIMSTASGTARLPRSAALVACSLRCSTARACPKAVWKNPSSS